MDENLNPDAAPVAETAEVASSMPAPEGAAPPPADAGVPEQADPPPLVQTSTGGVRTAVAELELARALPEAVEGMQYLEAQPADGTVHVFMDEAESAMGAIERRVMKVVVGLDGLLHKLHLPNFGSTE